MSNVIGGTVGTPYSQFPISFVRSGDLRDLSGTAVKYYLFLLWEMNLTGQVELEFTNEEFLNFTGIRDHSTAKKAREELQARGRIRFRKGPSGGFIHVMLDDATNVFPPAKGRKPIRYLLKREKPWKRPSKNSVESAAEVNIASSTLPNPFVNEPTRIPKQPARQPL